MDDPNIAWPAWKFGMKRCDLFTTLHDQYNTFSFSIQDPEAFHHDVYEISQDANTADEFHTLMARRQQQRLSELNESLESLAVEIIGNPKLIGTDQWQHALQLFRTKSFDSLVRYFASYLPDEYLAGHDSHSTSSSFSEADSVRTTSTKNSSVDGTAYTTFLDPECGPDGLVLTEEPYHLEVIQDSIPAVDGPLSPPESLPTESNSPAPSADESESFDYEGHTRSRSLSFSGSESDRFCPHHLTRQPLDEDATSQSDGGDIPVAARSVCGESASSADSVCDKNCDTQEVEDFDDDLDFPPAQFPEDDFDVFDYPHDTLESDTPTPRQESLASSYIEYKSFASRRLPSPYRRSPSPPHRAQSSQGGDGLFVNDVRRSPEEASCKIQKTTSDLRKRNKRRDRLA
ncbi:hypothetical protein B0I35DRAFT_273008 [Stachybotrys elegans]|uniref:Uncharacterized protein n=1 Tax=Stachybotrys elegans TaxID=80388 RepID=A0A8K0WP49_9HYPO|nr:hypothetical protein B0I35DRAFT_273008 [Stachybotrys elegans]